jgi:hypothetical protein
VKTETTGDQFDYARNGEDRLIHEMTMSTRFAKVREKVAEVTVVRQEGQVLGGGDDDWEEERSGEEGGRTKAEPREEGTSG